MPVCGWVCVVLYDATTMTFENTSSWLLYAKEVWFTFGRCMKFFCDGRSVVNKSRSAYSPVGNTFEKFNGLRVCSLAKAVVCWSQTCQWNVALHWAMWEMDVRRTHFTVWDCALFWSNTIQRRKRWNPTNFVFLKLPLLIDCEYREITCSECGVKIAFVFA